MVEKAQLWENRVRLEQAISVACQEVLEITEDMDAEAKAQWLGAVIAQLKCDSEDLHDLVNLGTPQEQAVEQKSTAEDLVTQLEEMEQEAK